MEYKNPEGIRQILSWYMDRDMVVADFWMNIDNLISKIKENVPLGGRVMPKIAEMYFAMGYLFDGGEFPHWLNEQEIPLGAIKEYEEAKEWFDKNIKSNFTA